MLLRCYPKITDFIFQFFNHAPAADYRFLPIYSYGFFVACGFFVAASLAVIEMRRKQKLGLLKGEEIEITVGESATTTELALYFIGGFIVFFKIGGLVVYQTVLASGFLNLKDYMLSVNGSWIVGLLGGLAVAYYYYYDKKKQVLPIVEKKKVTIFPSDRIGDVVIIAAILGVSGANFFNFLENPDDYANFWADPIGSMFSGLSIYGGLIFAGIGLVIYARLKKFNITHFLDSIAAGFILANGIGRIGCHVSGDGDWGLPNPYTKPDWFPQMLWSNHYQHNIIDMDPTIRVPGCMEEHCQQLALAAYPTPLYELMMCTIIFIVLWSLRKKFTYKPGLIMSVFMILIGIQRFAIEQWRDLSGRDTYGFGTMQFRQSEVISMVIFTIGVTLSIFLVNKYKGVKSGE